VDHSGRGGGVFGGRDCGVEGGLKIWIKAGAGGCAGEGVADESERVGRVVGGGADGGKCGAEGAGGAGVAGRRTEGD